MTECDKCGSVMYEDEGCQHCDEAKERQHLRECQSISKLIEVLALLCAGDTDKITDLLTGYLWDEEEAGMIKRASNT